MAEGLAPQLITSAPELARLVERLRPLPTYAIDTEFHRERTYFPQLALVQIATDDLTALVDPLATDVTPLAELFEGPGLAIMHAAKQDLEVLDHAVGASPARIFDTQIAGGFLGYSSPSLSAILERELGVRAPKADRLTDWTRRPLTDRQITYAASDVVYLHDLYRRMSAELEAQGRAGWAEDAVVELMAEPRGPRSPDDAWKRIKEVRHLRGADLAVAQAIAAWRETRAAEMDLTPRFVLADLGVVGLAVARPRTIDEMSGIRGVDARSLRAAAQPLIELIADAAGRRPRPPDASPAAELPAELRPALPLVTAWVSQRSRELRIEPALLATRSDIEAFLRGDPDCRLRSGWRAELIGEAIGRLVDGRVALAFSREDGLVLEARGSGGAQPGG